jgi:hypothetical protein
MLCHTGAAPFSTQKLGLRFWAVAANSERSATTSMLKSFNYLPYRHGNNSVQLLSKSPRAQRNGFFAKATGQPTTFRFLLKTTY